MHKWEIRNKIHKKEDVLNVLLEDRGILTDDVEDFLNPKSVKELISTLRDEFATNLKKASLEIKEAISKDIPIVIHGDYDADGICATAILYKTISKELKYKNIIALIPNRFEHGYGLSKESIDSCVQRVKQELKSDGKILFITVDSGITAVDSAQYLKELGHELIITDHHQKPSLLPEAKTIVWEDAVVGSSIAWFLSYFLGSQDKQSIVFASVATITDIQPVLGINRSIVKEGLTILNGNPPTGLKALIDVVGKNRSELTTYDLGWVIGPRLNASGRLVDASESLRLLLSDSYDEAIKEAENLNKINNDRQDKTMEMYDIANSIQDTEMPKIIISDSDNYHEGIIGLVAARLVKTYYRPAIVISTSEDEEFGKGSVRSVEGINIIEVLRKFEDMFVNVGGHPLAAGFTIKKDKIEEFKIKLIKYANENFSDDLLQSVLYVDLEVPMEIIDLELLDLVEHLKPFGVGNKEPLFASFDVGITSVNYVGREQKHVSFSFYANGQNFRGIFFNGSEDCVGVEIGDKVDIVYTINLNEYKGTKSVNLFIKDLKKLNGSN